MIASMVAARSLAMVPARSRPPNPQPVTPLRRPPAFETVVHAAVGSLAVRLEPVDR